MYNLTLNTVCTFFKGVAAHKLKMSICFSKNNQLFCTLFSPDVVFTAFANHCMVPFSYVCTVPQPFWKHLSIIPVGNNSSNKKSWILPSYLMSA